MSKLWAEMEGIDPETRLLMVHRLWIYRFDTHHVVVFSDTVLNERSIRTALTEQPAVNSEGSTGLWLYFELRSMTRIAEWFSAFIGLLETPAGLQETMGVHAHINSPAVVVSPRSVLDIYEESISAVRNDVELYFLDKMKEHEKAAEAEKQCFHEIADIREELSMIQSVFSQQERVWSELRVNILSYDGAQTAQDGFLMECNQEKIVEELFLQIQELEKSGKLDGTLEISPAAEVVADKLFSRLHRLKGDSQTKTSEYIAAKLRFRLCKLEFGKCNKEFLGRFTSMLIYNSQTYQRQKEESFAKAKDITNKVSTQLQRLKDRIEKADQSAERVQNLIPQYLELKRSATSMKEAHYTAVLGAAVFGLSFVTSVFTPMSFILALLAVPKDSVLVDPQPDGHKGHFVRRWAGKSHSQSLISWL